MAPGAGHGRASRATTSTLSGFSMPRSAVWVVTLDPAVTQRVLECIRSGGQHEPEELSSPTPQERRILELVAQGPTNRQIGTEMFLAEKTVKNCVSSLLAELGLERRTQVAVLADKLLRQSARVTLRAGRASHAGHGQELEDLDRSTHRGMRVPVEHLDEALGVLGLQDRVATDGVAGIATGLDHGQRGAEVDDGVARPLRPRHPGLHTRLSLLRRARSHLLGCSGRRTVEREELRHRRRSSRRVAKHCSASAYLGDGLNTTLEW
jgi:DNA-binding CsgD family transcriptional regulator